MTSLPNRQSDVIIDGNTFDYGINTDGNSQFNYSYLVLLTTSADSKIINNHFSGRMSNAGYPMVQFTNSNTCLVQNNFFIRNSNNIESYINAYSGANDHVIVNNIFDSSTTNGLNEQIVLGLTSSSIYKENKNQTAYAVITKSNHVIVNTAQYTVTPDITSGDQIIYKYYGDFVSPTTLEQIFINYGAHSATPARVKFLSFFQLDDYLPSNVQVLSMTVGLLMTNYPFYGSLTSGLYILRSRVGKDGTFDTSNLTGSLADVATLISTDAGDEASEIISTLNVVTGSSPTPISLVDFSTNTQYLTIDTTPYANLYITGKNRKIGVTWESYSTLDITVGGSAEITESPLLIKYRW